MEEKGRSKTYTPGIRLAQAALILSVMAVVFALAIGPRLRETEGEQARLHTELETLRQEITSLRGELAHTREQLEKAQTARAPEADKPELEVTDADGASVPPPSSAELHSRLAILDAQNKRLIERFNSLIHDLKASGVDMGIRDRGR